MFAAQIVTYFHPLLCRISVCSSAASLPASPRAGHACENVCFRLNHRHCTRCGIYIIIWYIQTAVKTTRIFMRYMRDDIIKADFADTSRGIHNIYACEYACKMRTKVRWSRGGRVFFFEKS